MIFFPFSLEPRLGEAWWGDSGGGVGWGGLDWVGLGGLLTRLGDDEYVFGGVR